MIDLTIARLPDVVEINGSLYSINTDFRIWMRFEIALTKLRRDKTMDVSYLFVGDMPSRCNINQLLAFARPNSPLPRSSGRSDVIVIDYELDADLIYSAFLGQYGIDLVDIEYLHWHKFLALLAGLNESTKLREVMGYRCYEKSECKDRDIYEELRRSWEIIRMTPEEEAEAEEFERYFS